MTTPTPDTTPRRRRRVGVILLAIGVLLLVAGGVTWVIRQQQDAAPPTTPSTTTAAAPTVTSSASTQTFSSVVPDPAALADGCLGGPDPFAAILPAQNGATHDLNGAAAFARTFGRWSVTYPIDPQAPQVLSTIVAEGNPFEGAALGGLNELARNLQAQGYTEAKTIADQGSYRISPTSTDERADLDLILYRQLTRADGRVEEMKMALTILLERSGTGPWFVSGTLPPLSADPFAPSATAPWLPFEGAC